MGSVERVVVLQGLVARAKWHQEMERREAEAKKASEAELYRKTHVKRTRNPPKPKDPTPAEPAATESSVLPAEEAVPILKSEGNDRDGPMADSDQQAAEPVEVRLLYGTTRLLATDAQL